MLACHAFDRAYQALHLANRFMSVGSNQLLDLLICLVIRGFIFHARRLSGLHSILWLLGWLALVVSNAITGAGWVVVQ